MPELAEVEYFRKKWNPGLGEKITGVECSRKRVFRGSDTVGLRQTLTGAKLLESRAHGKQMLFRFSKNAWLGVHLGMTGKLLVAPPDVPRERHDHLILRQKKRALIFADARQFGRILFDINPVEPDWWRRLPPAIPSPAFTFARASQFLLRRQGSPIKAVLLMQEGFPGIGNWMADEVLWQARIDPRRRCRSLTVAEMRRIFAKVKSVTRIALTTIGDDWRDPPKKWLLHVRWRPGRACPRDGSPLRHATVGGRTTCWCPKCQT